MSKHELVPFDPEQMGIIQSYRKNEARMKDKIGQLRAEIEQAREMVTRITETMFESDWRYIDQDVRDWAEKFIGEGEK